MATEDIKIMKGKQKHGGEDLTAFVDETWPRMAQKMTFT